jgi:hypothetical protein
MHTVLPGRVYSLAACAVLCLFSLPQPCAVTRPVYPTAAFAVFGVSDLKQVVLPLDISVLHVNVLPAVLRQLCVAC